MDFNAVALRNVQQRLYFSWKLSLLEIFIMGVSFCDCSFNSGNYTLYNPGFKCYLVTGAVPGASIAHTSCRQLDIHNDTLELESLKSIGKIPKLSSWIWEFVEVGAIKSSNVMPANLTPFSHTNGSFEERMIRTFWLTSKMYLLNDLSLETGGPPYYRYALYTLISKGGNSFLIFNLQHKLCLSLLKVEGLVQIDFTECADDYEHRWQLLKVAQNNRKVII